MSSDSLEGAIRDVAPSLLEPFPEELKQLTNQLYRSSKQKISLKSNEEVARLHLCAIIAVLKLQSQLNITEPSLRNLPVPVRLGKNLLSLFQSQLLGSAASTPISTPSLKRTKEIPSTPSPSPNKRSKAGRPPGSKSKTPFLRRLEAASIPSAFADTAPGPSRETSPLKSETLANPTSASTKQEDSVSKITELKNLQLLTSREIVTLCNKFQLQKDIADHIIDTFLKFSSSISNEWILIVGLVLNCYFVVNHKVMKEQLGNRSTVFKTMHLLQSGGLKLVDIQSSVDVVESIIRYNKWFKKLKAKYDYPLDEGFKFDDSGSMISEQFQYTSEKNIQKYKEWVYEIEQELKT